MQNKKIFYSIGAIVAVVVVFTAVYFGNSSSQKGALIMPRGRLTRPVAPQVMQITPQANKVKPQMLQIVTPVGENKPQEVTVTPPTLTALPFEGTPPANRVFSSKDVTVGRFEIFSPSKISLTGVDLVCNNLHEWLNFQRESVKFYANKNFLRANESFLETCGKQGESKTKTFHFTTPLELSAGSKTILEINLNSYWYDLKNNYKDVASFGLSSTGGFTWTDANGAAHTGFANGVTVTSAPLKHCEIDLAYSTNSCDFVYPIPSTRPYISVAADAPTGAVLKKSGNDNVFAKFTISAPKGTGDAESDSVDLRELNFHVTSNDPLFSRHVFDLRIETADYGKDGTFKNPGTASGDGFSFMSPNPAMFGIDVLPAGTTKTYFIKGYLTENVPENLQVEFSIDTGTPPAMGQGKGDGREWQYSTFAQSWVAHITNWKNWVYLPYRWMEPRGTTVKFGAVTMMPE